MSTLAQRIANDLMAQNMLVTALAENWKAMRTCSPRLAGREKGMAERLYVVMNQENGGSWTIADFWDLPFAHTNWRTAHKMRQAIEERQAINHWRHKKSKVAKVLVRP